MYLLIQIVNCCHVKISWWAISFVNILLVRLFWTIQLFLNMLSFSKPNLWKGSQHLFLLWHVLQHAIHPFPVKIDQRNLKVLNGCLDGTCFRLRLLVNRGHNYLCNRCTISRSAEIPLSCSPCYIWLVHLIKVIS